jgi:osmotically-inducible protein OsmY
MGTVDNLKAGMAAEDDAKNTVGVHRVRNHIKVRPEIIPGNQELETRVVETLARDPYVDIFNIDVEALNGKVALQGKVHTSFEKEHAEDVVRKVKGVVAIENLLEYQHEWTGKSDIEIRQDLKDRLFWHPFVNSDQVEIDVNSGVVTLKGKVDSWLEYSAAEAEAYEAGAKDVRNKLLISTLSMYELKEKLDETNKDFDSDWR